MKKKFVKIKVMGSTNRFNEQHPNSLIFLTYWSDDATHLIMVDNEYTRRSAEEYFDSVVYLGEIRIFEEA